MSRAARNREATLAPLAAAPRVSCITVCLDESPPRIAWTLGAIAAQDYPNLERIVLDGGSREATLAAVRSHARGFDVVLSQADGGIYAAMNHGVRLARGELVIFMHVGDRFVGTDTVSRLVEVAAGSPRAGFYYGDYVCRQRDGRTELTRSPRANRFRLYFSTLCHQSVLARREVFARIGELDARFRPLGDPDWLLRALEAGYAGVHTGLTVCEYEQGGDYCRDLGRLFAAWSRLRRAHYSPLERVSFGLGGVAIKTAGRLRRLDFRVPVRLAWMLGRTTTGGARGASLPSGEGALP